VVALLLERGARIDSVDNRGRTALMWAGYRGKREVVALLLERGANTTIRAEGKTVADLIKYEEIKELLRVRRATTVFAGIDV
jgi:uncharacterized protein